MKADTLEIDPDAVIRARHDGLRFQATL